MKKTNLTRYFMCGDKWHKLRLPFRFGRKSYSHDFRYSKLRCEHNFSKFQVLKTTFHIILLLMLENIPTKSVYLSTYLFPAVQMFLRSICCFVLFFGTKHTKWSRHFVFGSFVNKMHLFKRNEELLFILVLYLSFNWNCIHHISHCHNKSNFQPVLGITLWLCSLSVVILFNYNRHKLFFFLPSLQRRQSF